MAKKTRVKVDLSQATNEIRIFKKQAKDRAAEALRDGVRDSIKRGVSPVKGFGRFQQYSESYKAHIKKKKPNGKRIRPINLTLTGALMRSLFVKVLKNSVVIGFDNKLANIHNKEGAGKSKVIRRMLPTNKGEKFSRSITIRLSEALTKVARGIFKG